MIVRKKKSVRESFEQTDAYAMIMTADSKLDELILYYKQLAENKPEWADTLNGLAQQLLEQKGQVATLRDTISSEDAAAIDRGEEIARQTTCNTDYLIKDFSDSAPCCGSEDEIVALLVGDPRMSPVVSSFESIETTLNPDAMYQITEEGELYLQGDYPRVMKGSDIIEQDIFGSSNTWDDGERMYTDSELTAAQKLQLLLNDGFIAINDRTIPEEEEAAYEDKSDYIVLIKETDDPDEAFLEYRYNDWYQATGSFYNTTKPAALLSTDDEMNWTIVAMSDECNTPELKDILDEQVELLNA